MSTVSLYIIGTELTRGIIADSHIPFLTKQLTTLGFFIKRAEIVPDDGTIATSLETGAKDSDVLLVTGGLGPTSDDMTRKFIADLASVSLERNQSAWDTLYQRIGERIHGANEVQTMIPQGFDLIPNPNGTAPGFKGTFTRDGRSVFIAAMPGPPQEMQPMFYNYMLPMMADLIGAKMPERDEYSVFLIAEAKLEELCAQVKTSSHLYTEIEWGTRFQATKISLYISGADSETRKSFIKDLRKLSGDLLITDGCTDAVEMLTSILKEKGLTVSTAESATAGYLGKMLTDKAGSSAWYWGGMQVYSVNAKNSILKVSETLTKNYGTVSVECAKAMAENLNCISNTSLSLSVTGVAGPDSDEKGNPVGTICLGFATPEKETQAVCLHMSAHNREASRRRFATASMLLATAFLDGRNLREITEAWKFI